MPRKFCNVKDLKITDYTCNHNIYALQLREDETGKWLYINYSYAFDLSSWSIADAIKYYLSDEGYNDRMDSFYTAWGFYD